MSWRVVVTGMGVITPLGNDVTVLRDGLLSGTSGVGPLQRFSPGRLPTRIAAEVDVAALEIDPARDPKIAFAQHAARQAMAAARACGSAPGLAGGGNQASLSLGVGLEIFSLPDMIALRLADHPLPTQHGERLRFVQTPSDLCAHLISLEHGLGGPPLIHVSACAAGTDAIGAAFRLIASGRRRWMLAGGTDSMINPMGLAGFCKIRATSTHNSNPTGASRPFDLRRNGFVLGEGAGIMVLERREDALARGAHIHAEIVGYGSSFDAHAITEPDPAGAGAAAAIQRALADAGCAPEQVDAISAHGTSTPKNDRMETRAIRSVFGDHAEHIPISAPKSMLGHLISAAGAVEAIAAISCMELARVHPTINLNEPDPSCDLDYVPGLARAHPQQYVLSNSFAFGGQNAAVLIKRR